MKSIFRSARGRNRRRGITMVETLVATMIITVSMVGAVSMFMGTSTLSANTTELSTAQMLARRAIEEARNKGFANLADGTTTVYYNMFGSNPLTSPNPASRFKVVSTISTDITTNGAPDYKALRTLNVSILRKSDDKVLETSATYFSWGGV